MTPILLLLLAAAAPHPRTYSAPHTAKAPVIDGRLDDACWQRAPWTEAFVDIEGDRKPRPAFLTRAKIAWDQHHLYIAAQLEEPHVWATLTAHDSVIFRDNDFEVFIDPDGDNHNYFEFEINALNTGWDLFLNRPYRARGKPDNSWDIPGLRTAVHIEGTLNNASDKDTSWSVELAFPWSAFTRSRGLALPPQPGHRWRINFSRVEWQVRIVDGKYEKLPGTREDNWVWSPQHAIDMHRPETWGYVEFAPPGAPPRTVAEDPLWNLKARLHAAFQAHIDFRKQHGRFATTIAELGLDDNTLVLQTSPSGFTLSLPPCSLDETALLACRPHTAAGSHPVR